MGTDSRPANGCFNGCLKLLACLYLLLSTGCYGAAFGSSKDKLPVRTFTGDSLSYSPAILREARAVYCTAINDFNAGEPSGFLPGLVDRSRKYSLRPGNVNLTVIFSNYNNFEIRGDPKTVSFLAESGKQYVLDCHVTTFHAPNRNRANQWDVIVRDEATKKIVAETNDLKR